MSNEGRKCARTESNNSDNDVMDVEAPPPGVVRGEGVLGGREVSVSHLFSEEDQKIAIRVIWSHGGSVVAQLKGDYHVVPLEVSSDHMPRTKATLVTMIWLVRCTLANRVKKSSF